MDRPLADFARSAQRGFPFGSPGAFAPPRTTEPLPFAAVPVRLTLGVMFALAVHG